MPARNRVDIRCRPIRRRSPRSNRRLRRWAERRPNRQTPLPPQPQSRPIFRPPAPRTRSPHLHPRLRQRRSLWMGVAICQAARPPITVTQPAKSNRQVTVRSIASFDDQILGPDFLGPNFLGPTNSIGVENRAFDTGSLVVPFFGAVLANLRDTRKTDADPARHRRFHRYLAID